MVGECEEDLEYTFEQWLVVRDKLKPLEVIKYKMPPFSYGARYKNLLKNIKLLKSRRKANEEKRVSYGWLATEPIATCKNCAKWGLCGIVEVENATTPEPRGAMYFVKDYGCTEWV